MNSENTRFSLDQCPGPAQDSRDYDHDVVTEYGRFASDIITNIQQRVDGASVENLKLFVMGTIKGDYDVTELANTPVTYIAGLIAILVIVGSLIFTRMVSAGRKGWMNKVTKHFWFVAHWTFILAQMAVYILCLIGICAGMFFFVASFNQYSERLETLPQQREKVMKRVGVTIEGNNKQAECVYESANKKIFAPLYKTSKNMTETYITDLLADNGIEDLKLIDREKIAANMKKQLDAVSTLLVDLKTLEKDESLKDSSHQSEVAQTTLTLRAIRSQLSNLNVQMGSIEPQIEDVLKTNENAIKSLRIKFSFPLDALMGRINGVHADLKNEVDRIDGAALQMSQWTLGNLNVAGYFDLKMDKWRMYDKPSYRMMQSMFLPAPVVIFFSLIALCYCIKMLRRSDARPMNSKQPERLVTAGFYGIIITTIFCIAITYGLFVFSTPLSAICAHTHGNQRWEFYNKMNMTGRGEQNYNSIWQYSIREGFHDLVKEQSYNRYNYYENQKDGAAIKAGKIDLNKFADELEEIAKNADVSIQARIPLLIPLKVSEQELTRNVDDLKNRMSWSGILPSSRKVSDEAELIATRIGIFALDISQKMTSLGKLMTTLEKTTRRPNQGRKTATTAAPYSWRYYSSAPYYGDYRDNDQYRRNTNGGRMRQADEKLMNDFRNYDSEMLHKMVRVQRVRTDLENAGYVMCEHVKNSFDGIWVAAMLSIPLFLIVAVNLVITGKALSVAATRNEISLVDYFKSGYQKFLDRLNNKNQDREPLITEKFSTNPLVAPEFTSGSQQEILDQEYFCSEPDYRIV